MKKLILCAVAALGLFTACDPSIDNEGPAANITSEELTKGFEITAKTEGNNNLTVNSRNYVWICDATTDKVLGKGYNPSIQILPPARDVKFYALWKGADGQEVKSDVKTVKVDNFTDLDPMLKVFFGENYDQTTTWTWDDTQDDGLVWSNGGYLSGKDCSDGWWKVSKDDINGQCESKGLPNDVVGKGWFTLSLQEGVKTSRGETGSVIATSKVAQEGWDIGTLTFEGTVPLMGIMVNNDNQRQYTYQILKYDGDHLILCAPEPGVTSSGGTAWFWRFKRIPNK